MNCKNLLMLWTIALLLLSCEKEDPIVLEQQNQITDNTTQDNDNDECSEEFTLYAGQFTDVGSIVITNDDTNIYVTYNTINGWVLNETHLYVGHPDNIPTNNAGNPQIGQFPYNDTHNNATSFTITVPIDESLDCYAVAAHASVSLIIDGEVVQSETAWSDGDDINDGGSWATYSEFCLLDCCEVEPSTYTYIAGQNIEIGSLEVTNDDENLYITYNFNEGWFANVTHLYVGALENLPTNNANIPIPGQFPYSTDHDPAVQTYTYTIPLSDIDAVDCPIIAAHSEVVLIDDNGDVVQTETGWSYGDEFPDSPRWGWYSEYCYEFCE